jgi:hypothetical protein
LSEKEPETDAVPVIEGDTLHFVALRIKLVKFILFQGNTETAVLFLSISFWTLSM